MQEVPKRIKRQVREWAGIAHDRDLSNALGELRAQFGLWERGEIDSFELNTRVHRFHEDTSREIWKRYASTHLEPAVALAGRTSLRADAPLIRDVARYVGSLIGAECEVDADAEEGDGLRRRANDGTRAA